LTPIPPTGEKIGCKGTIFLFDNGQLIVDNGEIYELLTKRRANSHELAPPIPVLTFYTLLLLTIYKLMAIYIEI